jgi:LacI family transcriptional regulator
LESLPPQWLKLWDGDGIISRTVDLRTAKMLKATRLPCVELFGSPKIGPAQVVADLPAIGNMAANHFCESGLKQFAYFTFAETDSFTKHRNCFSEALKERGYDCNNYPAPATKDIVPRWDERQRSSVVKWLRSLPHPIGIFTPGDTLASRLLNICRELEIAVPEEMAILGSGNDMTICQAIRPSLSSMDLDAKRFGYEAARTLARTMAGEKNIPVVCVAPSHIEVRQSTDVMVVEDADVVQAMRFIRERACFGIDINDVADHVGLSLSGLLRKFRRYIGRTPKEEIMRVQIEYAKKLLTQTDRNCTNIAKKSGFHSISNFTRAFRREAGMTPNTYRRIDRS